MTTMTKQPSVRYHFEHDHELYVVDVFGHLWRRHPHRCDSNQDVWKRESFDGLPASVLSALDDVPDEAEAAVEDRPELPSWDEAPKWAQWRAVNKNGTALWLEEYPVMWNGWFSISPARYLHIDGNFSHIPWQDSIEQRPFEPPWDKIASPYDKYFLTDFGRYPHFYGDSVTPVGDVWTRTGDYPRIERGRVYRRPSK